MTPRVATGLIWDAMIGVSTLSTPLVCINRSAYLMRVGRSVTMCKLNATTLKEKIAEAKREFLTYGFASSPLTDEQIEECLTAGTDPYGVGCDVYSGFD